jgi:hypothetical protein
VTTNFFEEIGKIRFNSVNSRKNAQRWKKLTNFTNHKKEKKRKEKNWYRGIYVCTLNKL